MLCLLHSEFAISSSLRSLGLGAPLKRFMPQEKRGWKECPGHKKETGPLSEETSGSAGGAAAPGETFAGLCLQSGWKFSAKHRQPPGLGRPLIRHG